MVSIVVSLDRSALCFAEENNYLLYLNDISRKTLDFMPRGYCKSVLDEAPLLVLKFWNFVVHGITDIDLELLL
jgi:hypothetical protein